MRRAFTKISCEIARPQEGRGGGEGRDEDADDRGSTVRTTAFNMEFGIAVMQCRDSGGGSGEALPRMRADRIRSVRVRETASQKPHYNTDTEVERTNPPEEK